MARAAQQEEHSERKNYVNSSNNDSDNNNVFFNNQNKTAWLKFDNQLIQNEKDFWAISPYSTKGPRKSSEIWKDELGDQKRNYGQQRTYYGSKNYIFQRIGYNLSQAAKNLPGVWQQYDDFPSHDEAFDRADSWFNGQDSVAGSNNNYVNKRRARINKNKLGSQLNPDTQFPTLDQDAEEKQGEEKRQGPQGQPSSFAGVVIDDLNVHNNRAFNQYQSGNIPENMKVEISGDNNTTYVSYPDSEIYWKCPNVNGLKYSDIKRKIENRKNVNNLNLNNLNGKKIYCGSDLNDYLRLKICYNRRFPESSSRRRARDQMSLGGEREREQEQEQEQEQALDDINPERDAMKRIIDQLERDFPELKNLENFGNPGQCFAYGKIYKNPDLKPSYMFFTH